MSDIMRPIPFSQLMNWIIEEHKTQGAVFGVRKMVTTNQEGPLSLTNFPPSRFSSLSASEQARRNKAKNTIIPYNTLMTFLF